MRYLISQQALVISNFWRCLGRLVIKVIQKLFQEISKESKIKEIIFKDFRITLPRPSKQWTLSSICNNVNLLK